MGRYTRRVTRKILPQLTEIPSDAWTRSAANWLHERGISQVVAFQVPMSVRFRAVEVRQGLLLKGPYGWGECAPFLEYEPPEAVHWWRSAVAEATRPGPRSVREQVPVNVTIPVSSAQAGAERAARSGAATAKVKVADVGVPIAEDARRVRAVADALAAQFGEQARVRVDANGAWTRDEALGAIEVLNKATISAGGLEYVEQPCASVEELAYVRARTGVRIAADESIRRAEDPLLVVEMEAADLAVIKVAPLGGVNAALDLAAKLPLPMVVSSALDTSIGLAAGVLLAAALPDLPAACGLDTARLLTADATEETLASVGGYLSAEQARQISSGPLAPVAAPVPSAVLRHWLSRGEALIAEAAKDD